MAALGVSEADLEESFVRSGGHGGQNVNKTSTCVMLAHRPTGLQVKCQATRQQGLNRFIARRLLLDKIEERQRGFVAARRWQSAHIWVLTESSSRRKSFTYSGRQRASPTEFISKETSFKPSRSSSSISISSISASIRG